MYRYSIKLSFCFITFLLFSGVINCSNSDVVCLFKNIGITPYSDGSGDSLNTTKETSNCAVSGATSDSQTIQRICELIIQNDTATIPVSLLTVKGGVVGIDKSFYQICRNGATGLLSWLQWHVHEANIKNGLEVAEGHIFVGRINKDNETKMCTVDLTNGRCRLINSTEVILNLNETEILVEKLPIRYELQSLVYQNWKNVSGEISVVLSESFLII